MVADNSDGLFRGKDISPTDGGAIVDRAEAVLA